MTVKHQPATPLPFSDKDDAILGADGTDAGLPEVSDQNLAYVIHAANAYPKLVEALREIAGERTNHLRSIQMQDCINTQKGRATALLRELGEAS